jgi:hypothetical protein
MPPTMPPTDPDPDASQSPPGPGPPPPIGRPELLLARKAARERWGVPDDLKTELILQCWTILADPRSGDRKKLAAGRLLVTADRVDQRQDMIDGDAKRDGTVTADVVELSIERLRLRRGRLDGGHD